MTINNKLISIDKRYKLNSRDIEEINVLRNQGMTLDNLSKQFKVSQATILYWTDKKQREKQRLKNAKRRKKGLELKTSIKNQLKKMKMCAFRKTFIKDCAHRFLTFVKFSSEKLHSYPFIIIRQFLVV